ncbi:aminopeptidase N [Streptomyces sp. MST-110588]|uniref:aminopeptidase N n=1 Tax=Streptomyces sp. MST-110588 TaxID=2833628 RepID=UPI001F5D2351|nr:aminopeptidase N [Streptomyces sp. MST-110588]UNO43328.1 aminopeptidase N [Streptomyces sp. MST-110588]
MSGRSLTQTEAEGRASLLTVERYDVAVDLSDLLTGSRVRCESTITFTSHQPGAETFVDCPAAVESATLNGVVLRSAVEGRIALTDLAEHNVLTVVSVTECSADGWGVHKAVDPADGERYFFTDFAPDYAHHVSACFDQPDLKAPWAFTVTAPAGWRVLSNSGDPQIEDLGSVRRWTFPPTPPLAAYNTVINAGPYYELRRRGAGHDLGLFCRQSLASILDRDADELFTLTTQGLEFFAGKFGMPFPQHKYDQVFTPEYPGAMENFGCVTWMDWFLRRTTPTRAEWDIFSRYLLHELAHMWFGNIVTMRWWDDLWLNEAFAEFASNWAAVSVTSYTDAWTAHLVGEKLKAYFMDQGPMSHPIRQQVRDVSEAEATFDAITYPKGASVLHQLMTYVGEANFSAGLTNYLATHAWGSTTLQDLIDAVAGASGRDLDQWRTAWLETAGTDRLTLDHDTDGFTLVAQGPGGRPRPHVLAVGAYEGSGDHLERMALVKVEVAGERTRLDLPAGADLYLVNDEDLTFTSTRPDATTRDAFFRNAARLPTATARGVAVATAWDMLINGEATAAEAVQCLTGVLAVETSASVIEPYLNLAVEAADLWSPQSERDELLRAVAAACRSLSGVGAYRKAALRGFARTATEPEEVAWLQAKAGEDIDLQWRALVRKAQLGSPTAVEAQALLDRDPDPDAWISRLQVRAATLDAAEKKAVWQALVTDCAVPLASIQSVATLFWSAGQDDLLRPHTEAYLDLVQTIHHSGTMPARTYTKSLFPVFGIDLTFVERAQDLAAQVVPVVRTNLLDQADRMRRILRSRG